MSNITQSSDPNSVDYGQLSLQIINILAAVAILLIVLATKVKSIITMCKEGQTSTEKKLEGVHQSVTVNIGELKQAVTQLAAEVKAASAGKASPTASMMSDSKTSVTVSDANV